MSYSVMNNYLKLIKNNINEYMKIILDNKYNKSICDEFIDVYTSVFYYDSYNLERKNKQKNEINKNINEVYNKLISSNFNIDKSKVIDVIYDFFEDVLNLESLYKNEKEYEKILEKINDLRKEKIHKEDEEFKVKLIEKIKENLVKRKEFLEKYESKEFYIQKKKKDTHLYNIELKYNIKFPMIYSEKAINKVFNSDIVSEDKLFIEYMLISIQIINDIENGIYNQNYLVEFTESLFEKKQKISRLLYVIDNQAIQDRLSFVIDYKNFIKYKDEIYNFVKSGFKIAINLDESFEFDAVELKRLTIFSYVLIDSNFEYYQDVLKNKNILENIIEI